MSKLIILGIKRENKEKIYRMKTYLTPDSSVCSITARDNVLIFGTETGHVVGFDLPSVNHVGSAQLPFKPTRLALNSNATLVVFFIKPSCLNFINLFIQETSNFGS